MRSQFLSQRTDKAGTPLVATQWMTELLSFPLLLLVLPPFLVGCLLSGCQDGKAAALGVTSLALLTAWGSIVNHHADWQSDAINSKRRLLHQQMSRSRLARLQRHILIAYVTLVTVGFMHQPLTVVLFLVGLLGALQYSTGLKIENRLWLNGLYLALAYGVYPLSVGLAIGGDVSAIFSTAPLFVASFLLFIDLGVAPFKDFGDVEGDRKTGKRTLPSIYGPQATVFAQAGMIVLALVVVALQQSYGIHETRLFTATCLAILLLLYLRLRVASHHAEFLHYAALLACCCRFILIHTALP